MANGAVTQVTGGNGGASFFGGAGASGYLATSNSGSGGHGGLVTSTGSPGGGGGAGAYVNALVRNPNSSYSLNVGQAGGAGGAGS